MVKLDGNPRRLASRRRMRTHAEWNVDTHIFCATGPTRAATRCFISSAALLVNVMARIWNGLTRWSWMRWAMRCVSTRVLPDPAPATTKSGPSWCVTASCCTGLSPERRSSGMLRQPYRGRPGGPATRPWQDLARAHAEARDDRRVHHLRPGERGRVARDRAPRPEDPG